LPTPVGLQVSSCTCGMSKRAIAVVVTPTLHRVLDVGQKRVVRRVPHHCADPRVYDRRLNEISGVLVVGMVVDARQVRGEVPCVPQRIGVELVRELVRERQVPGIVAARAW
jgi:hypothetical protein